MGPRLQGLRVLAVDDRETNLEVLTHQLAAAGVACETADGGERALQLLRTAAARDEPFAATIVDYNMPGMDGVELARAIRQDPAIAATRAIIIGSTDIDEAAAREAGVVSCLIRPVRQSELHERLADAMAGIVRDAPAPAVRRAAANLQAHVLLAEDNPVNQEVALTMLEQLGCSAEVANNGHEALEALQHTTFDLVLMDGQMPEMDGFATAAEVRRREAARSGGKRIPIIALTAGAVAGDREKCLAAGMDDYVAKPFSSQQLEDALRRWLPAVRATGKCATRIDSKVFERMQATRAGRRGTDFVKRLIGVYLNDAPNRLRALKDAVVRVDAAAIGQYAHGLKSASANVGATALADMLQRLEGLGRAGALGGTDELLSEIDVEFAQVATELEARAGATE